MFLLSDIITYVRRIIKSPSNSVITDNLIIDYINRFYLSDIDARMQLFDFKTKYQFQTQPGVDQYNMPLYNIQIEPGAQNIASFPVYQGFMGPAYINGVEIAFYTQRKNFFDVFPNIVQNLAVVGTGNGSAGPYTLSLPILGTNSTPLNPPIQAILRGHVDITGIIATGANIDPPVGVDLSKTAGIVNIPSTSIYSSFYLTSTAADGSNIIVQDSGQFLTGNTNYGLLMAPGSAPFGYSSLANTLAQANAYSTTQNTINYITGVAKGVTFPASIPSGANINAQCYYFNTGLPRAILYYNNTLTLRVPPSQQWLVELDAYLTPAAFLTTGAAVPFGYMSEYIARGAARKILSDTGDVEQFNFYEDLFREQEMLVWKRSQRQFTSTRTETIYSRGMNGNQVAYNNLGGITL